MENQINDSKANLNHEYEYLGTLTNGFLVVLITILLPVVAIWLIADLLESEGAIAATCIIGFILEVFLLCGFFVQQPNMARVMVFFGKYRGSCRKVGFYWINPLMSKIKLSLRIRNMDIEPIKVNDKIGNPVLIGMVLVWRIKDTYKVVFDLDSQSLGATGGISNAALDHFVRIQSDAALREVTGHFAYDNTEADSNELTLRDGGEEINSLLERKINERLAMAGMEVVEARLNYLAYAPEIAAVMLRRQQASAIITAREKIVEGAVSMVEMALNRLEENNVVKLDDERKAAMVSNLMVVLCADEGATPVLGVGGND